MEAEEESSEAAEMEDPKSMMRRSLDDVEEVQRSDDAETWES